MAKKVLFRVVISNPGTMERIRWLSDCGGFATLSKFMDFLLSDYEDLKYRVKTLERENEFLRNNGKLKK